LIAAAVRCPRPTAPTPLMTRGAVAGGEYCRACLPAVVTLAVILHQIVRAVVNNTANHRHPTDLGRCFMAHRRTSSTTKGSPHVIPHTMKAAAVDRFGPPSALTLHGVSANGFRPVVHLGEAQCRRSSGVQERSRQDERAPTCLTSFFGGRMPDTQTLVPARQLAAANTARFPNESTDYRTARNALLVEEIELRRHIERVAAQRRALPSGGRLPQDFEFVSEKGPVRVSTLFQDKETLMIYSMMYGPQRQAPCPMCTSFLSSWNGTAGNLGERVAMAVTARSPIDRLIEYKKQRGFANLRFVSDMSGEYTRTYVNPEDADVPGFSVFSRRDGIIRHFYTGEMSSAMADPGQDPRGGPDLDPLWLMLDLTLAGRGTDWYPELDYGHKAPTSEQVGQGR